jgi:hypothetical protein
MHCDKQVAADKEQAASAIKRTDAGKWGIEIHTNNSNTNATTDTPKIQSSYSSGSMRSSATDGHHTTTTASGVDQRTMQSVQQTGLK